MNKSEFGPDSTNPRMRRAYAHAVINKARKSGEISDIDDAISAVDATGESRKSLDSGFDGAIEGAARQDFLTDTITVAGNRVLDIESTPRKKLTWVGTDEQPKDLVSARRYSPDFELMGRGATLGITEVREQETGVLLNSGGLDATSHDKDDDRSPQRIPITAKHTVDAIAVRRLPLENREKIAGIASRIA